MRIFLIYCLAAIFEIAGCFAFWAWLKLDKSALWIIPGSISLVLFAYLLTLVDVQTAGRAYGAIYIASSLAWLWLVEQKTPDHWDLTGLIICLAGAGLILWGPRP